MLTKNKVVKMAVYGDIGIIKEDEEICGEEVYVINKKTLLKEVPYSEIFG